jgi:hypothetical protein
MDVSGLKYYYGDISFSIKNYTESIHINLSINSYDFSYGASAGRFGNKEISNNNYKLLPYKIITETTEIVSIFTV